MASLRQFIKVIKGNNRVNSSVIFQKKYLPISYLFTRNFNNVALQYTEEKDPAPFFFNKDIQNILKTLTRIDISKVFRHRRLENKKIESPVYKFMSDDELKSTLQEATDRANDLLQMPPVVKIWKPINEILSEDTALKGYDTSSYIFTDITYGISNRDRLILKRDPDGILSKVNWDIRHRMNQIYFPETGRDLSKPHLFDDENFKSLLNRKEYEFILDKACIQFEPDDPEYQKVTSLTYQHLNEQNDFELLRSTRHFGPLVFFLVWFKSLDNLLLELISTSHITEANNLILLHNKLHENDTIGKDVKLTSDIDTAIIEEYIKQKSSKKGQLELALQSYKELIKQKLELEEGIKRAHGIS